ncbi:MAG TPA: HDIG domain-containing protein [Polyangia bacterium]|nr:HDIG domain-containing protein [Polyangia bacterium]
MTMSTWAVLVLAAVAAGAGAWLGRRAAWQRARLMSAAIDQITAAIARTAHTESAEILRAVEVTGLEEARAAAAPVEAQLIARRAELETRAAGLARRQAEQRERVAAAEEVAARTAAAKARLAALESETRAAREKQAEADAASRGALEQAARQSSQEILAMLRDAEVEETRVSAARTARAVTETAVEAATKRAKRIMGIAVGRFYGHYLTERLHAIIPLPPGAAGAAITGPEDANLRAIESAAGVTLAINEPRDAIRLEGLDGVGREVARRVLARLQRQPALAADPAKVAQAGREIAAALDRELDDLGRRAFQMLEIPPAHAEIVRLVGRLNYRTSYTQNQWKHAVEAAYLCGMMADELGLDEKTARRAALMHDIGKALTHELDGSHAVIGADFARRLGEAEVVANAIGAHHTDEPFNSPYAYLVAGADAMSGGRPGARRQTDESYLMRVEDLERITRSFPGVAEAFAVQGGREVRVYVEQNRVDDLAAVNLSTEIAGKISREMRFPGQIRVTVIRELRAVEVAS